MRRRRDPAPARSCTARSRSSSARDFDRDPHRRQRFPVGKGNPNPPGRDAVAAGRLAGRGLGAGEVLGAAHVRGVRRPVRKQRRRQQPRQIVAHRAGAGERRQVGGPLGRSGTRNRAGEECEQQRDEHGQERGSEGQRQRLATLPRAGADQPSRDAAEAARRLAAWVDPGEDAPGSDPARRAGGDPGAKPALPQLADRECRERAVPGQLSAYETCDSRDLAEIEGACPDARRHEGENQLGPRSGDPAGERIEAGGIRRQRDPADAPACRRRLQPLGAKRLLQLSCPCRGEQCR